MQGQPGSFRRMVFVIATLLLAALVPAVSASAPSQVITLSGKANTSTIVVTTSPLTVTTTPWDSLGGPSVAKLGSHHVGFLITDPGSGRVLVGALRDGGVERVMGAGILPYAVHFGSRLGKALPPGTYRAILMGGASVQIHTTQRHASMTWRTRTPERVLYRAGHPEPVEVDQPLLLSQRTPVTIGVRSYALLGMAESSPASVDNFCLTSRTAATCVGGYPEQNLGVGQQPTYLPRTGSTSIGTGDGGGASFTDFQPGEIPRGSYDALFTSTGQVQGEQPVYVLLALPG